MEETLPPALIEEAINAVKKITTSIRTRARLIGSKTRDILDNCDALDKYADELKEQLPTQQLLDTILTLSRSLTPYVSEARNLVRVLENFADRLEEKIP